MKIIIQPPEGSIVQSNVAIESCRKAPKWTLGQIVFVKIIVSVQIAALSHSHFQFARIKT